MTRVRKRSLPVDMTALQAQRRQGGRSTGSEAEWFELQDLQLPELDCSGCRSRRRSSKCAVDGISGRAAGQALASAQFLGGFGAFSLQRRASEPPCCGSTCSLACLIESELAPAARGSIVSRTKVVYLYNCHCHDPLFVSGPGGRATQRTSDTDAERGLCDDDTHADRGDCVEASALLHRSYSAAEQTAFCECATIAAAAAPATTRHRCDILRQLIA